MSEFLHSLARRGVKCAEVNFVETIQFIRPAHDGWREKGWPMERTSGFKNKVALVVGGASGMGNAVVRLLVREGCRVHVFDVKDAADVSFQRCDIRDYSQVRRCVKNVVDQEGTIDLLFVAAGVHLFANIEDTSIEEFERVLSINLKGPFYVLKEVLPVMRKQLYGNVVLMGSDQVFIGKGCSTVYGMSKAALGQLTKSSAIDYAPYNVRVNCICPGTIDSPMIGPSIERFHQMSGMPTEKIYEMLRAAQPIQRLGTPEEIGKVVLFLLSDDCPFMTGSLISADGGYTCQ
jgi:NAD(P)-dependent dehydrogenase (short-subunit alcohol dehydrogenase family)